MHLVVDARPGGCKCKKNYLKGPQLDERAKRRAADGVDENLAERDKRDSQRAAAPLMIPLGARVIDNSAMTAEETSTLIINEVRERLEETK